MTDRIRLATAKDCEEILEIYQFYVVNTPISFEVQTPTIEMFAKRIETIANEYPYLVFESNNHIVGYCYGSKHRERQAYCYNVDVSIYISPNHHGKGIAKKLYEALFPLLKEMGYYNSFAACTIPNEKSLSLHLKFGFIPIGTFENVGYKLEKWHNVMWLQKKINDNYEIPSTPKTIKQLSTEYIKSILNN